VSDLTSGLALPLLLNRKMTTLATEGGRLLRQSRYDEATQVFQCALELLPEPRDKWQAGTWLVTMIGNCHFLQRRFADAYYYFREAQRYPGGLESSFLYMRIGECLLEFGCNEAAAVDAFVQAYLLTGADETKLESPRCMQFLKQYARVN